MVVFSSVSTRFTSRENCQRPSDIEIESYSGRTTTLSEIFVQETVDSGRFSAILFAEQLIAKSFENVYNEKQQRPQCQVPRGVRRYERPENGKTVTN